MMDAEPQEVSRQLWAFLGPLVAGDASMESIFANVPRHYGFDAWRRIAEPVNDDKAVILQDLLGPVTNPKGASSLAGFGDALKLWETNVRLFTAAGGHAPEGDAKRLAFIKILPPSVAAHVTLHDEIFQDFEKLKRFAIKYVKVNTGLDAQRGRPVKLLQRDHLYDQPAPGSCGGASAENYEPSEQASDKDAFEDGPDAVTIPY